MRPSERHAGGQVLSATFSSRGAWIAAAVACLWAGCQPAGLVDWTDVRAAACRGDAIGVWDRLATVPSRDLPPDDAIRRGRYLVLAARALQRDEARRAALAETQALEAAYTGPLPLERALDYGEVAFFGAFGEPVRRLFQDAAEFLDARAAAASPDAPEPDALGIPGCTPEPSRTFGQARALARLRLGTAALQTGRWAESATHFEAGLAALPAGVADRFGEVSYGALLHNNRSELAWLTGDVGWAAQERLEAVRLALAANARQTLGLASAGLALIGVEPEADPDLVPEALLAAWLAEPFLHEAGARPTTGWDWYADKIAKLHAVRALHLARAFGTLEAAEVSLLLESAEGLASTTTSPFTRIGVALWAGATQEALGDWAQARGAYARFLEALAVLWTTFGEASFQRGIFEGYQRDLRTVCEAAYGQGDTALAFHALERSKDIALLQRYAWSPEAVRAAWRPPTPATLSEVRGRLAPDETLVHYERLGADLLLLYVSASQVQMKRIGAPTLDDDLEAYRRALADPLGDDRALEGLARRLHDMLIAPVAAELASDATRRLFLVPRGALHSLAWSTLRDEGGRFLVDRYTCVLAPSATQLRELRRRSASRIGAPVVPLAAIVGSAHFDPAETLRQIGADPRLPVIDDATTLVTGLSAQVLHVKAHGRYSASDPSGSSLELVPRGAADAAVPLSDLARMPLAAETVVLQSCEAARTEPAPGDQADSFARAFLAAGARAVIAPLWTLPEDTTRQVSPRLHARLRAGADAADALRGVQLELRSGARGPLAASPRVWGIYTVTGAP